MSERAKILRDAKPNTWVALSADESKLLAVSEDYLEALEKAEATGEKEPVLIRRPDSWMERVY